MKIEIGSQYDDKILRVLDLPNDAWVRITPRPWGKRRFLNVRFGGAYPNKDGKTVYGSGKIDHALDVEILELNPKEEATREIWERIMGACAPGKIVNGKVLCDSCRKKARSGKEKRT